MLASLAFDLLASLLFIYFSEFGSFFSEFGKILKASEF